MNASTAVAKLTREQLVDALKRVGRTNDMLPPREDDKVAGRIATRFVEGLLARIASGEYECAVCTFVPVPKRTRTTRPAAVATLRDRIIFEALVGQTRGKIAKHLVSNESVLWPRADDTSPTWNNFERAPLDAGGGYIVSADVAGFYESVDHRRLVVRLADAGVTSELRSAIEFHLQRLMSSARGLPQGVETSDALATLYLTEVDSHLRRVGIKFWRHGDDYRMLGPTYPDALKAIYELEQALRATGLLLNSGKLTIDSLARYTGVLNDVDRATAEFREAMRAAKEQAVLNATVEELVQIVEDAGIDEDMQWRFFYHETLDMTEMLEELAPVLTPGPIEVVAEMFRDVVSKSPKPQLPANLAHVRRVFCLRRLAQARSPDALPWVGELLVKRPDETQALANYMLALVGSEAPRVVAACQYALTNKKHILDWERAWIYRVLSRAPQLVHARIINEADRVATSDAYGWLARVEALRLLARTGKVSEAVARHVTRAAPASFQGDIVGIIIAAEDTLSWASQYIDGVRQDALQAVIIDGVRAKERQKNAS